MQMEQSFVVSRSSNRGAILPPPARANWGGGVAGERNGPTLKAGRRIDDAELRRESSSPRWVVIRLTAELFAAAMQGEMRREPMTAKDADLRHPAFSDPLPETAPGASASCSRSQRFPYKSANTATGPYGSCRGASRNCTPRARNAV